MVASLSRNNITEKGKTMNEPVMFDLYAHMLADEDLNGRTDCLIIGGVYHATVYPFGGAFYVLHPDGTNTACDTFTDAIRTANKAVAEAEGNS